MIEDFEFHFKVAALALGAMILSLLFSGMTEKSEELPNPIHAQVEVSK